MPISKASSTRAKYVPAKSKEFEAKVEHLRDKLNG
jgi:hypothetical protein